ncbi:MAG: hypothetical protein SPJ34_00875 [Candidatus Ornithospirochaeta sp.]|nr:hypothetical protein [Candidatus Ornithospirochaeta sp.]
MNRYRSIPVVALVGIAVIVGLMTDAHGAIKIALMAAALISLLWYSRGTMYFAKANKLMQEDKPGNKEKALENYRKAVKAGLPNNFLVTTGSIVIQHGDIEEGRKILEKVLDDPKTSNQAKVSLSMYYWLTDDLDRAIELCEDARSHGYNDRNLYINLGTYYINAGRIKDFKKLNKDAYRNKKGSPAVIDLEAVCSMMDGNWKEAGFHLTSLFDRATPHFIDPYIHFAQVYIHYGKAAMALEWLKKGRGCTFSNTSLITRDELEELIEKLEAKETRLSFVNAFNASTIDIINGRIPEIENGEECSLDEIPGFPELDEFIMKESEKTILQERDEDDVCTDLTEEDEKWLEKHRD